MHEQKSEQIQGVVKWLTHHSQKSGYTVARFQITKNDELITIVGKFADIQPGQTLQLTGFWKEHPSYGQQFEVTQYKEGKPATLIGIEKYLGSGLIKGIGSVTAKRIVAQFGLETLEIIDNQIERLAEVPGIAKKRIKHIQSACQSQKLIKEVMDFLKSHGVSTTYAVKIYKQYGDKSIVKVTENPYELVADIYGIGFMTADSIARNLGITPESEFRYRCGIIQALRDAADDGHCFLPQSQLIKAATKLLTLPSHQPLPEQLILVIIKMAQEKELVIEDIFDGFENQLICYKLEFYLTEQQLAHRILSLLNHPIAADLPRVQRWITRFTEKTGIQLNTQQQEAVKMAASSKVLILTGNPGTGKTFCTRTIVALWKAMGKSIALVSPTGRAAKRLSEMTDMEAKTLHRLLAFNPKTYSFKRNQDNPIPTAAIVVDETSMLDLFLANSLMKAISDDTQLLLVGDIDQLPSVGPGRVLQDIIASGKVPVIKLTEVFRQAQTSSIIVSAHSINQGQYPKLEPVSDEPQSDCLIRTAPHPIEGVEAICNLVSELIPRLGFNPLEDVQVLCPMNKGEVGTQNLNRVLQQLINPPSKDKTEIIRGGIILRVGDRILQKKNNYDRDVFNGDLGIVRIIDLESQEVSVQFEEKLVTYAYSDLDEINLAWSITIHKGQGSEYPVVILPIFMQHYPMLSRNLLYTGLTRARQLAILVGQEKAIGLAVKQVKNNQRYTLLSQRLINTHNLS